MNTHEPLTFSDPKLAALGLAIGGRLTKVNQLPSGRLEFVLDRVPLDLPERVLNDEVQVSARRFIDSMEGILAIIAQRRRVPR